MSRSFLIIVAVCMAILGGCHENAKAAKRELSDNELSEVVGGGKKRCYRCSGLDMCVPCHLIGPGEYLIVEQTVFKCKFSLLRTCYTIDCRGLAEIHNDKYCDDEGEFSTSVVCGEECFNPG